MIVSVWREPYFSMCSIASDSPETHRAQLEAALTQAEGGAGVLVLADLFGGTPSNIASLSLERAERAVVTGVNLPMLLEALMRRDELALAALALAALQAGRAGIVDAGAMLDSSTVAARRRGDAA